MPDSTRWNLGALTNTEYERMALEGGVNLSDGHARVPLDHVQHEILASIPALIDGLKGRSQNDLEQAFLVSLFGLTGQCKALEAAGTFLTFSSSSALKMVAQACRIEGLAVQLIEPVFDNIRHFLVEEGVPIHSISEDEVTSSSLGTSSAGSFATWIVMPNNPTGWHMTEGQFSALAARSSELNSPLIIDASFRAHSAESCGWDMYRVLQGHEVDYIVVEDTGKTWSLFDIKVGATLCSPRFRNVLHRLHDQLLLNVSPVHLELLREFIEDSRTRGLDVTVKSYVRSNGDMLHETLQGGPLAHRGDCLNVPMDLYELPPTQSAQEFWRSCRAFGLEILPAYNYYWTSDIGRRMFRVPLARPIEHIEFACEVFRKLDMGG